MPDFAILGSLIVRGSSGVVEVNGARRRALLVRLLLSANEVVPAAELIEDLWGRDQPRTVVKSLQVQVGQLRRLFTAESVGSVATRSGGYALEVDDDGIDAVRFERLVRAGRRAQAEGSPSRAGEHLHAALGLWRGRALLDVESEPFAQPEITRLEELRVAALEDRFDADLALGRHRDVVGEVESFLQANGLRERAWGQLIVAYYRCGRQADALRAYQRAGAELAEIGLTPGPELHGLEGQVLDQDPALDWQAPPSPGPGDDVPVRVSSGVGTAGERDRQLGPYPLPIAADVRKQIVGRHEQLDHLAAAWDQVGPGQRRMVLVEGDPGIGKTRVAAEAAAAVTRSGGMVLWGRCDESATNPYQPFTEAMEQVLQWTPDEQVAALAGSMPGYLLPVIPRLSERLADVASPVFHHSGHDRFLVLDAVAAVLSRLLEQRPVLVVIDDLHWAPPPTVHLLRHWINRSQGAATMLIGTYRLAELEVNGEVRSLLADVVRDPGTATITLDDLTVDDLEDLVGQTLSLSGMGDLRDLARHLHRRTGGNPLLTTQLLRSFIDAPPDRRDELSTALRTEDVGGLGIPSSIRHVIRDRTGRLPDDARRTLEIAAVMGTEFDVETIQLVLGSSPAGDVGGGGDPVDALPALEATVRARLIDEMAGGARFRFVHSLVRDSIYSDLSALRRARLHHRLADAMLVLGRTAPVIAHHFHLAVPDGGGEAAIEWLEKAGLDHMGRFAYDDARRSLEQGIALVDRGPEVDRGVRARLGLSLARCLEMLGEQPAARRHAEAAAADARSAGSVETLAYAAIQRAGFAQPDSYDDAAAALFARALEAVGDGHPDLRALLLSRAALSETVVLGRSVYTDALALEAIALARTTGDRRVLYAALAAYVHMTQSGSDLGEQRAMLAEMAGIERTGLGAGDPTPDPYRVAVDPSVRLRHEALSRLRSGDLEAFEAVAQEIAELGRMRRDWFLLAVAQANRAVRALLDGRFADVPGHVDEMARLGGHDLNVRHYMGGLRFLLARERGSLHELEATVRAVNPRQAHTVVARASLASVYLNTGRAEEAYRLVDEFLPRRLEDLSRVIPPPLLAVFAEVCSRAHDTARAAELHDRLRHHSGQLIVMTWTYTVSGAVDRYLGLLAAELGRDDEAEARFAAAVRLEDSLPSPPLATRTRAQWGEWLLGRAEEEQRERGRLLVEQAATAARRLGMESLAHPATV